MNKFKKHKSTIMVGALVLLLTLSFQLGGWYAQNRLENNIASAKQDTAVKQLETYAVPDELSLEFAQELLNSIPDAPLLARNAKDPNWGESCLEVAINDVNATMTGAEEAILRVCKEAGIDADKAKVKDLTVEQIGQIDQEVFQKSDHPKN